MFIRMIVAGLCLCTVGMTRARAQDVKRLEADKLDLLVPVLSEATAKLTDLPIKVTLDGKRAMGMMAKKAALVVIPDAKLTLDVIKKLDKEPAPLGILYLHKVTPIAAEQAIPADQHRTIDITVETKDVTVSVVPLAVGRVAGRLVLLAYTNAKTPTLVTELVDATEEGEQPLDLDARGVGSNRAAILVNVLGRYRAAIPVAGQE